MNEKQLHTLERLIALPPVQFSDFVEQEHISEVEVTNIESLALHLLRIATYADVRCGGYSGNDGGHKAAVKHSNKVIAAARKAIGYNTTHDINY